MKHEIANSNNKIRIFVDEILEHTLIRDEAQVLTIQLHNQAEGIEVIVSTVYAKCTQVERM